MSNKNKTLKVCIVILIIILALLVGLIVKMKFFSNEENNPSEAPTETTISEMKEPQEAVQKNDGTISIPGFEGITLTADVQQQTVALSNPAENNCYFQITLMLEDGTVLWESELIAPAETSEPIYLNQPLEKGTYPNAKLLYKCFRMDEDLSALNGAETKLTLRVK